MDSSKARNFAAPLYLLPLVALAACSSGPKKTAESTMAPIVEAMPDASASVFSIPGSVLGAWEATDGSGRALLFQHDRVAESVDGELRFFGANYLENGVELMRGARTSVMEVERTMDGIRVFGPDGVTIYEALDATPNALLIETVTMGNPVALTSDDIDAVQDEMRHRLQQDQAAREFDGAPTRSEVDAMLAVDRDNSAWLRDVVERLGWPDATRFDAETAQSAFLLVQHSADLGLMEAALPAILADVDAGLLNGAAYAMLFDRFQVATGRAQRFGSQIGTDENGMLWVMTTEDPSLVDERRAEFGMASLDSYLDNFVDAAGNRPMFF